MKSFIKNMETNKINFIQNIKTLKRAYKELLNEKFERYFCYNYFFDGDDSFTIQKQRLFFLSLYKFNSVAISKFGVGEGKYDKVIYIPLGIEYDVDGKINKAAGLLTSIHLKSPMNDINTFEISKKLDQKNAVFCELEYSNSGVGLWYKIQSLLDQISEDFCSIAIAQNFSLPKFIWNNFNEEQSNDFNEFENNLFNFQNVFVKFKQNGEDLKVSDDPVFKKISFITPSEIAQKISNIKNKLMMVFQLLGVKASINFKKERQITAEIEADDAEFLPNNIQKEQILKGFIKDYKEFFGKELKIVNMYENKLDNQVKKDNSIEENNEGEIDDNDN